jgi:hypothetical protein
MKTPPQNVLCNIPRGRVLPLSFQLRRLARSRFAQSIARPAALIGDAFLSISLSTNFCK